MQSQLIPKRETGEVRISGRSYTFKKLLPLDFIEGNIPFNIFETTSGGDGMAGSMDDMEDIEEDEPESKNVSAYREVLERAIDKFDYEKEVDFVGVEQLENLAQIIISFSLNYVEKVTKPSRSMLLTCYALAKQFGGTPYDYLTSSIESFLFNQVSFNAGLTEEERLNKIAEQRRKNK